MSSNAWNAPASADGQRAVVEEERQDFLRYPPYRELLLALAQFVGKSPVTLTDIGCGVGHYALFLKAFAPNITYRGFDSSQHMIDHAKALVPDGDFTQRDMWRVTGLGSSDVVLLSATLEYAGDPWAWLKMAQKKMKVGARVIIHRTRWHKSQSGVGPETIYGDKEIQRWYFNQYELAGFMHGCGFKPTVWQWQCRKDIGTMIGEKVDETE